MPCRSRRGVGPRLAAQHRDCLPTIIIEHLVSFTPEPGKAVAQAIGNPRSAQPSNTRLASTRRSSNAGSFAQPHRPYPCQPARQAARGLFRRDSHLRTPRDSLTLVTIRTGTTAASVRKARHCASAPTMMPAATPDRTPGDAPLLSPAGNARSSRSRQHHGQQRDDGWPSSEGSPLNLLVGAQLSSAPHPHETGQTSPATVAGHGSSGKDGEEDDDTRCRRSRM